MIATKVMPFRILAILALLFSGCANPPNHQLSPIPENTQATLAILESTDLHSHVLSFDYYKLAEDPAIGFERFATLVKQARQEFDNTLLFDAGDTIQGTALADYQAQENPLACDQKLAIYKAMDALHYDGGTIGNHEFNYGLPFLGQVTGDLMKVDGVPQRHCHGPAYPLVLANVLGTRDNQPIFPPYAILDRTIHARSIDGRAINVPVRIGIIGFAPPPITQWDKPKLKGQVYTQGLVETARRFLPELKAKNTDFIIAISHGGIDASPYSSQMENANLHLAKEPDIDVLLLGHSHAVFPDPGNVNSRFNNIPDIDNVRGFIHGKPAVMGNFWGKSLGVIKLALIHKEGHWIIDHESTHSEVRSIRISDEQYVESDPQIEKIIAQEHAATLAYMKTPIGDSDFALTSYFSIVGDVSAIQIINMAQRNYAERYIQSNLPQYANLPVLSAAAPFKTGFGGANDYTDIPAGILAIHHAADLYPYPNTIAAVKVNGAMLKGWLERSANCFNQIDPSKHAPQKLINHKTPTYNFDIIQGNLSYAIDITQANGKRIVDLRYNDKPIDAAQEFIIATNNYRANGSGRFPGLDGSNIVFATSDTNRDVIINYIREQKHMMHERSGNDRNWHFVPVKTAGPVIFTSATEKLELAHAVNLTNVYLLKNNGSGMATYNIDLSGAVTP